MDGRKNIGGGVSVMYNNTRFTVKQLDFVNVPEGVEVIWGIVNPVKKSIGFKHLCIASAYIAPRSKFKKQTIDHIIEIRLLLFFVITEDRSVRTGRL